LQGLPAQRYPKATPSLVPLIFQLEHANEMILSIPELGRVKLLLAHYFNLVTPTLDG
jgi:hypothetical protein